MRLLERGRIYHLRLTSISRLLVTLDQKPHDALRLEKLSSTSCDFFFAKLENDSVSQSVDQPMVGPCKDTVQE